MISVIDTSVLITFYELNCLHLFNQLFNEVYIPVTVEQQFLKRDTDKRLAFLLTFYEENKWFKKCQSYEADMMQILSTMKNIDEGERETMAQYKSLEQAMKIVEGNLVCILDERIARKVAKNMDIRMNGTLYLLAQLDLIGHIQYAKVVEDLKVRRRFSLDAIKEAYGNAKMDRGI